MDVIRAFAIIAVVLIHVSAIVMTGNNISSRTYNASMVINQIARFSVPAFILISGIGLTLSYKKEQGYFKFLARRFNKIIPSYILWCMIYIYFTNSNIEISNVVNSLIYGKVFYHFYYIPLIIQFYLVYPFIYRFIGTKRGLLISFLITFGIIIFTRYYILSDELKWFFDKKNLLDWIFYFSFGAFIGKNLEKFLMLAKKYKVLILISFLVSICIMLYDAASSIKIGKDLEYAATFMRPAVLLYSVLLILFIFSVEWKENIFMKIVNYISKNSYAIYLSHALVLYYFMRYYTGLSLSVGSAAFEVKAFIVTLIGSIFLNEAKRFL
ncbi:acyltransferase [Clostridium sp. OS1-26]|uniref:acyltransferase n=1 Tax=Clostridium sp. OS1-26 TaxID=3070681 RepID=UPI0027DFBAA0|nr:acyltransferase [Clostridium sp. OS1-26]WML35789.1 acyltransferase [Clostridium sp. OS1-26]